MKSSPPLEPCAPPLQQTKLMNSQITSDSTVAASSVESFSGKNSTTSIVTSDRTSTSKLRTNTPIDVYKSPDVLPLSASSVHNDFFIPLDKIDAATAKSLPLNDMQSLSSIEMPLNSKNINDNIRGLASFIRVKTVNGETFAMPLPPITELITKTKTLVGEDLEERLFEEGSDVWAYEYDRSADTPNFIESSDFNIVEQVSAILYRPATSTIRSTNIINQVDNPDLAPIARYLRDVGNIYGPLTTMGVANATPHSINDPGVAAWMYYWNLMEFASVRPRITSLSSRVGNVYMANSPFEFRAFDPDRLPEIEMYSASLGSFIDYRYNTSSYNTTKKNLIPIPFNVTCTANVDATWAYIIAMVQPWKYILRRRHGGITTSDGTPIEPLPDTHSAVPTLNHFEHEFNSETTAFVLVDVGNYGRGIANDSFFSAFVPLSSAKDAQAPIDGDDIFDDILFYLASMSDDKEGFNPYNIFASMYPCSLSRNLGNYASTNMIYRGYARGVYSDSNMRDAVYGFGNNYRPLIDADHHDSDENFHYLSVLNGTCVGDIMTMRVPQYDGFSAVQIVSGVITLDYDNKVVPLDNAYNHVHATISEILAMRRMWFWDTFTSKMGLGASSFNRCYQEGLNIARPVPSFNHIIYPTLSWFVNPGGKLEYFVDHVKLWSNIVNQPNDALVPHTLKFTRYGPYVFSSDRPILNASALEDKTASDVVTVSTGLGISDKRYTAKWLQDKFADPGLVSYAWVRFVQFLNNGSDVTFAFRHYMNCKSRLALETETNQALRVYGILDVPIEPVNVPPTDSSAYVFFTTGFGRINPITNGRFKWLTSAFGSATHNMSARTFMLSALDAAHLLTNVTEHDTNAVNDLLDALNMN